MFHSLAAASNSESEPTFEWKPGLNGARNFDREPALNGASENFEWELALNGASLDS